MDIQSIMSSEWLLKFGAGGIILFVAGFMIQTWFGEIISLPKKFHGAFFSITRSMCLRTNKLVERINFSIRALGFSDDKLERARNATSSEPKFNYWEMLNEFGAIDKISSNYGGRLDINITAGQYAELRAIFMKFSKLGIKTPTLTNRSEADKRRLRKYVETLRPLAERKLWDELKTESAQAAEQ